MEQEIEQGFNNYRAVKKRQYFKFAINEIFIDMNEIDKMLELLKEQEARLIKEKRSHLQEGKIMLSPKIDIEESLRNGYITADDYEKTHHMRI